MLTSVLSNSRTDCYHNAAPIHLTAKVKTGIANVAAFGLPTTWSSFVCWKRDNAKATEYWLGTTNTTEVVVDGGYDEDFAAEGADGRDVVREERH